MKITNEYIKTELIKINELLVSGSLHDIDEASHISARLIVELSSS